MSFSCIFLAGKILKESISIGSHSTPFPIVLLRSLWVILQVVQDWKKVGIFKDVQVLHSQGWCLPPRVWASVLLMSKTRDVTLGDVEN